MHLTTLDLVVLAAYLLIIVSIGVLLGRRMKDTDDYFVGGRRMPSWVVGISILGTCISSVTYVAYPGKAFVGDWQYLVQGLMLPVVLVAGGFLAVKFYRRKVKTSINEFMEERFGPRVRVFSMIFLIVSELARIASVLFLFSLVVHTVTGLPIVGVIIIIGAITIAYAVAGGIQGVIWTDLLQSAILVLGGLLTVAVVSLRVEGGFFAVIAEGAAAGKFRLFDFSDGLYRDAFWVLAFSGLVNYFYFLCGNQNQIQRYQCTSDDKGALRATIIGSLLSVPTWALFMLVGTCLFVYYQQYADPAVLDFMAAGKGDQAFPHFIATGLPTGLSGLLLAGLFGAAMSSLDSSMNAASTLAVTDLYRRFLRPDAPEKRALNLARLLTLVWGLIGVALALAMIQVGTFLDFYFKIVSLVIGAIAGIVFLALVSPRAHGRGVMVGIGLSLPVMAWGVASMSGAFRGEWAAYAFPWHAIMVGVTTTLVVAVGGYLASLVLPRGS